MKSRRKKAAYRSVIRAVHVRETRARIVAAALEELQHARPISLARVARRAGVAVPTAYRHFRSASLLLKAVMAHILLLFEKQPPANTIDELVRMVPAWFESFDRNKAVVRARFYLASLPEFQQLVIKRRKAEMTRSVRGITSQMSRADALRATAVVHVLQSSHAWELMRGYGLSGRDAGETAAWAIQALVEAMRRENGVLDVATRRAA